MKKNLLPLLALLMCTFGPVLAQTSQKITAGKATEYGLIYSLPVTALDITIEAELSSETPGEFSNYARRHLGDDTAIRKASRSARLKSITITPRGIADPENRWVAQFKAGSTPFMILSPEGIPLAINTEEASMPQAPTLPEAKAAAPSPLETEAARQAVTQEMARSSSVSKRAELAAQRIFELREMRSDILSGQSDNTPPDGKAMQLVLDNIAAQEAALTAMFLGTRSTRTDVRTIELVPDSAEIDSRVIARISAIDGIVDADNLAGAPVRLSLQILEPATLPANDKGEPKRFPKGGVAYTIPGTALVSVDYEGSEAASKEVSLAQLGVTFGLDPALFTDKKAPSMVRFDPTTGAILIIGPAE
ncbi:MAG: DUF4831 family protein [Muribaculaceae bacterium]|nr:DUF4831 family protein [Muribaculaceae bacterium]